MTGLGAALRGVRGDLNDAADRHLIKVVAMLDGLANRGEADGLIAALRPRLARLRPPRPLSFHRLMFLPFDPLIVAAANWSRDTPVLPRTVVRPLGDLVRAAAPAQAVAVDRLLAAPGSDDWAKILRVGKVLWPAAAEALLSAAIEADWQAATGLRETDFQPLCYSIGVILRHFPALLDLIVADTAGIPLRPDDLAHFMAPFGDTDVRTLAMLITMLNLRLPHVEAVRDLSHANHPDLTGPNMRQATEQAHAFLVQMLETAAPPSANLDQAEAEVTRMAAMIDAQSARLHDRPAQLGRIAAARNKLDVACRASFVDLLAERVLAPIATLGDADDSMIDGLERDARALRRFDLAARKLGGGAGYDQILRATTEKLRPRSDDNATARIDKLRLAEILLGSTAAAEMT